MRIAGLVLAGGRSRRFGSEKAMARLDGEPLVAHVAAVLRQGCGALAVNAPARSGAAAWAEEAGLTVLGDPVGAPDGPLTGVLEGVRWAAAGGFDALATAPCDTPRLPHDLVPRLHAALGDRPAASAATAAGSHPLCSLWRVELATPLAAILEIGHPPVRRWLADLGAADARFGDEAAFANVNTPAELRTSSSHPSQMGEYGGAGRGPLGEAERNEARSKA